MPKVYCFLVVFILASPCFSADVPEKVLILPDGWTVPDEADDFSGKWIHAEIPRIEVRYDPPSDWSDFSSMVFSIDSKVATGSDFILYIGSENKDTEGIDYYAFSIKLDWTGRKDFHIPLREINMTREPVGWHHIDRVAFIADGWGNTPHPEAVVEVGDFKLSTKFMGGTEMTDAEFFESLNLSLPELKAVRTAVEKGDYEEAEKALAEHIRNRERPKWYINWRDHPFMDREPLTPDMDRAPDQWDYFSRYIQLDWEGWKKFTLKKDDFDSSSFVEGKGTVGKKPIGWSWIGGMSFRASGWGLEPDPKMVLNFDDVKLVGKDKETLVEDFEENREYDALQRDEEIFKNGSASGKWSDPIVNKRVSFGNAPKDSTDYDQLEFWLYAPEATGGRIILVLDSDYPAAAVKARPFVEKSFTWSFAGGDPWTLSFEDKIDWSGNPTTGEDSTHLWNEKLNRHFHFDVLSQAYWNTGDELFAEALVEHWMDWIESNPKPVTVSGNRPSGGNYSWQTLTTGIRMERGWWDALYRCLRSLAFTDEVITSILKSTMEQAEHLLKWPSTGNWLTEESYGLLTMGMLFPEFEDASEWRRVALERIYKQLDDEIYPDGLQYELAPGYSNWVTRSMTDILERADMNGYRDEVPADYQKKLEKMYDYLLLAMMPNGHLPGLNDSGRPKITEMLMTGYELFPERDDFLFGATLGAKGRKPDQVSVDFPYSGHYVMRSDWDKDAVYLLFDSGLLGRGHYHEDKLHFVLYAYGNELILDPGNYSYDRSKWRKYVTGTAGHNTIMVDGEEQYRRADRGHNLVWPKPWDKPVPPGNDTVWIAGEEFDYVKGIYNKGYGPDTSIRVEHTRRIVYLKPDVFVIHDTLIPEDDEEHHYEAMFHFNAEAAEIEEDTLVTKTITDRSSYLCLYPVGEGIEAEIVEGLEEPVQGWTAGPLRPTPTLLISRKAQGRVDMFYLLCPVREGERAPVKAVSLAENASEALGVNIEFQSGQRKIVTFTDTPGQEFLVE